MRVLLGDRVVFEHLLFKTLGHKLILHQVFVDQAWNLLVLSTDPQENFLQRSDRNPVPSYLELTQLRVKIAEKLFELSRALSRHLIDDLISNILKKLDIITQGLFHICIDLGSIKFFIFAEGFLFQREVVPNAIALLQEQTTTDRYQVTVLHDADPVTEHVCFVHVMSRQDDDAVVAVGS